MNLEELYTRPAFNTMSMAHIPLSKAGESMAHYVTLIDFPRQPALQAFAFYYLDHCVALIKQKHPHGKLPQDLSEVVDLYHALVTRFGSDMYAYLFLICNREFRYCKSDSSSFRSKLGNNAAVDFGISLKNAGSSEALKKLRHYDGVATLGSFCEVMTEGYYKLNWSSMYGGKKWGDIAKVLENYVLGKIPLMTLLDQSFSLQHNTCAIFNKGGVYEKEANTLLPLLDIQHAGQMIPLAYDLFFGEYDGLGILGYKGFKDYAVALSQAFVVMAKHFEGLDQHVDWQAVINGNPATPTSKLAQYKKDWYAKFGIYDVEPKKEPTNQFEATATKHTYYEVSPTEMYKTFKRSKG